MEHVVREFGLLPFKSNFGRMNTVVLKKKFNFLLGVHTSTYSLYKYSLLCQLDSHRFYKILHYNFHGKQINSNSIQQLHIDRLKCAKHNTCILQENWTALRYAVNHLQFYEKGSQAR